VERHAQKPALAAVDDPPVIERECRLRGRDLCLVREGLDGPCLRDHVPAAVVARRLLHPHRVCEAQVAKRALEVDGRGRRRARRGDARRVRRAHVETGTVDNRAGIGGVCRRRVERIDADICHRLGRAAAVAIVTTNDAQRTQDHDQCGSQMTKLHEPTWG
jgi:hypothetical protein